MGYKLNGVLQDDGLPIHLVKALLANHDIPYLVETGTANGESARWAANNFKKVWTIEVVKGRADVGTFPSNVTFLEGDSAKLLHNVIDELNYLKFNPELKKWQYVIFFLDAHYCDDVPNESGYPECPLLAEISAISTYGESAIIIIDDARLFFGPPPHPNNPEEWPGVCEIMILLKEKFPYSWVSIIDDYIVAIPHHLQHSLWQEWRSRFKIRYPDAADKLKSQVQDVYKALIDYIK